MNKKYVIITLICLTIVGALFTMLGSNMFFGDILNKDLTFGEGTLFVSLPSVMVAVTFATSIMYVIRVYRHPDSKRALTKLYSILAIALNGVGIIGAILAAIRIYGTLFTRHPFPGYLIIFIVFELLIIGASIYGLVNLKKMSPDEGKIKITVKYVFKTIGWFLFIMVVLNRFGTFLTAPLFIYWRNFNHTAPFYVYLLVPLFFGVTHVLFLLGILDKKKLFIFALAGLGASVALEAYTIILGVTNTGFISSLSQAMPLERMLSKPIEILLQILIYTGVGVALIVESKKKDKEEAK